MLKDVIRDDGKVQGRKWVFAKAPRPGEKEAFKLPIGARFALGRRASSRCMQHVHVRGSSPFVFRPSLRSMLRYCSS